MRGNMINKLYKKIFLIYYITSVTFITFITLFMIYNNYSSSINNRSLLFQSYTNNIILQLQNNIAISEKAIEQYNANIPILVLITTENDNILFSYRSSEIEISSDLLKEKIQEQMLHYFKTDSIHNNASPQLYSFETTELNGEKFKWSYIQINASNGTMYELYTACLINHKIFSFSQIVQYIFLEIFLLAAFFFLGKYIVRIAIMPINQNMESQKHFIASASHELKTPLSVISIANTSNLPNAKHIIEQECIRMDKIVKTLLFIASSETNTWKTEFQPADFERLLAEFYELSQPLLLEHKKKMDFMLPDNEIEEALLDKTLVMQLLTILLDNAISHSDTSDLITLELKNEKENLQLYFIDHGSGIPDKEKPYIFNRFYKSQATSRDHYGLGLSIAKTIMDLHHGKISIKDTPGGGATFILEFPMHK